MGAATMEVKRMNWFKKWVKNTGEAGAATAEPSGSGGCDHGAIELREGTADFEWFVARAELETKHNLAHGANHLSSLLSFDPGNKEWIELLEQYIAAEPDVDALIPRKKELYYSTEAMRAYIWHKQGKFGEAVNLLANVANAKPDSRYLEEWALSWLEPNGAVESLPEKVGWLLFSVVLNRFPECQMATLRRVNEAKRWACVAERFFKSHPTEEDAMLMVRAGLFRKAGMFEEAEALVQADLARRPNWHSATALGLILRQKGDPQAAEIAFKRALELDPTDITARLEAGDTFFEKELWEPALGWYESALKMDPRQEWALPSAQFCRYML